MMLLTRITEAFEDGGGRSIPGMGSIYAIDFGATKACETLCLVLEASQGALVHFYRAV